MMNRHVMVDLETLGLRPDSVILSIGAVVFDANTIDSESYWTVELDQPGRRIDADTVRWWLGQSEGARRAIYDPRETWTLGRALDEFAELFDADTRIWANGANFDIVLLEHAYSGRTPWKYKNTRCYRTVRAMFPGIDNEIDSMGDEHNALDDARHQTRVLQHACATKGLVLP